MLQAIKYSDGNLAILDQLQLPHVEQYVTIRTTEEAWHAIREMRVRGAPAIAIVAALGLASELSALIADNLLPTSTEEVKNLIVAKLHYLVTSRPTAVNLSDISRKLEDLVVGHSKSSGCSGYSTAAAFIRAAEGTLVTDVDDNKRIGENGAKWIMSNALGEGMSEAAVLTHCNTGSLATSGYGTALGVIRSLFSHNALRCAYCTETRPYNQGSRLTAFELIHDKIPATLITDSMAAALLARADPRVDAIVVGADRIAANGDTANKIGTYGLAVLARQHNVRFLVAAPRTTIDLTTKSGDDIDIEQRPPSEVTRIRGYCGVKDAMGAAVPSIMSIAADGIDVWNPAFDVTPSALIDGIITEVGVVEKDTTGYFDLQYLFHGGLS